MNRKMREHELMLELIGLHAEAHALGHYHTARALAVAVRVAGEDITSRVESDAVARAQRKAARNAT